MKAHRNTPKGSRTVQREPTWSGEGGDVDVEDVEEYAGLVRRLQATGYPPQLIALHVKLGLTLGKACGSCARLGTIWLATKGPEVVKIVPICTRSESQATWDQDWPACGAHQQRKEPLVLTLGKEPELAVPFAEPFEEVE